MIYISIESKNKNFDCFTVENTPFDNNEILITKEEAVQIALDEDKKIETNKVIETKAERRIVKMNADAYERINNTEKYYEAMQTTNYPNEEKFTRITEFKYLTNQEIEGETTILKEYPLKYDANNKKCLDPYYPIINEENIKMYNNYKEEINKFHNIHLVGRLAEYKYYNMDAVIEKALEMSEKI